MKTPDKPHSSKRKGKDEESAPDGGKTPSSRFQSAAVKVLNVPREEVTKVERKERKKRES